MSGADPFLVRLEPAEGDGPRLAVKDLIDLAGTVTTAGCRAVASRAVPAERDAACLAGFRAAAVRVIGKTALNELAYGVHGENHWYGTPANPLDAGRMPGGSSSGSAVSVATGEADLALGTDTGGSIRIPAACCGVAGLKTTWGSLALEGIRPLAPSFDTVGPLAGTVSGVAAGYALLLGQGGGQASAATRARVARVRGLEDVDEEIDAAIDAALASAELAVALEVVDVVLTSWRAAFDAHRVILGAEAWAANRALLEGPTADPDGVSPEVIEKLERGRAVPAETVAAARLTAAEFRSQLDSILSRADALALPTLPCPPPLLGEPWARLVWLTAPINLAGLPALAMPVPASGSPLPASLQLVGAAGAELDLLALGLAVENALS